MDKKKIYVIYNPTRTNKVLDILMTAKLGRQYSSLRYAKREFKYTDIHDETLSFDELPRARTFDIFFAEANGDYIARGNSFKRSTTAYGRMVRNIVATLEGKYRSLFTDGLVLFPTLLDAGDVPLKAIRNCLRIAQKCPNTFVLTDSLTETYTNLYRKGHSRSSPMSFYDYEETDRTVKESLDVLVAKKNLMDYLVWLRSGTSPQLVSYKAIESLTGIRRQRLIEYMNAHDKPRSSAHGLSVDELDETTLTTIRNYARAVEDATNKD